MWPVVAIIPETLGSGLDIKTRQSLEEYMRLVVVRSVTERSKNFLSIIVTYYALTMPPSIIAVEITDSFKCN
uniref:Uncharacterized protein n=1 Tax=Glossina palpalis gambiensis TaxID=67801 RepID=A0A1B0BCQ7_9MUSC